jgi:hypothetical protein
MAFQILPSDRRERRNAFSFAVQDITLRLLEVGSGVLGLGVHDQCGT